MYGYDLFVHYHTLYMGEYTSIADLRMSQIKRLIEMSLIFRSIEKTDALFCYTTS